MTGKQKLKGGNNKTQGEAQETNFQKTSAIGF